MRTYEPFLPVLAAAITWPEGERASTRTPLSGRGGQGWPAVSTGQVGPTSTMPNTRTPVPGNVVEVPDDEASEPHPAASNKTRTAANATAAVRRRWVVVIDLDDPLWV